MQLIAAQIRARRRRTMLVTLGLAVLLGVGGIAFVAGRTDTFPDPSPPSQPSPAAPPSVRPPPPAPAVEARTPTPPPAPRVEPAATTPPAAPGFLVVKAQPWGKLLVDGKYTGDVEGTHRYPLAPGSHTLLLVNGKKSRRWNVDIESGKTVTREHSFLED
jgi:hypothetical protein